MAGEGLSDVAPGSAPKIDRNAIAMLLSACAWLIGNLPRATLPYVAAVLGAVLRPLAARDRAILRVNVHKIFSLPPGSHFAQMFERQVFRHQLICAMETMQATYALRSISFAGEAELRQRVAAAEATGKPHLFVTAHLGSWELCAYHCARSSTKPSQVLAKPPRVAAAKLLLDDMRRRMGVSIIWTGSKTILRDMLGTMRRNESLGFVMDQKPEGRQGPVVPFFGIPTAFVAGPASMALKFDATIIALFCVREGPFRYRILSETVRKPGDPRETDAPDQALTAKMAAAIERAIRTYPEQWTWSYKRWRFPELN